MKLVPELAPGSVAAADERDLRERVRPTGWIQIGLSSIIMVFLVMLQAHYPGKGLMFSILVVIVAGVYFTGCGNLVRAKGYRHVVGLVGALPIIGIVVIVRLRPKEIGEEDPRLHNVLDD